MDLREDNLLLSQENADALGKRQPAITHPTLTDVAVLAEAAGEERHRGEESQGLFDHTLQILEFLQVLDVCRPIRLTFNTFINDVGVQRSRFVILCEDNNIWRKGVDKRGSL